MDYEFRLVDVGSEVERDQAASLLTEAYGGGLISWRSVEIAADTGSKTCPSIHVGAYHQGKLIGFNSFISHQLMLDGRLVNAYQSCLTATSSRHRGKGVFSKVMDAGKAILRERGAAFIFGFPNDQSGPIFRTQLAFRDLGGFYVARVPRVPLANGLFLRRWGNTEYLLYGSGYGQNDAQLLHWKRKKYGDEIRTFSLEGNVLWGRRVPILRHGLKTHALAVGGIIVNDPHLVDVTIQGALAENDASFGQFIFHRSSVFSRLFARYSMSDHAEHLIVFPLSAKIEAETTFNFWTGVKDVY